MANLKIETTKREKVEDQLRSRVSDIKKLKANHERQVEDLTKSYESKIKKLTKEKNQYHQRMLEAKDDLKKEKALQASIDDLKKEIKDQLNRAKKPTHIDLMKNIKTQMSEIFFLK